MNEYLSVFQQRLAGNGVVLRSAETLKPPPVVGLMMMMKMMMTT